MYGIRRLCIHASTLTTGRNALDLNYKSVPSYLVESGSS